MTTFDSRAYRGAEDLPPLVDFARRQMANRAPVLSYVHPDDVTWQLYLATAESDHIRLWFDAAGLAAYAIFEAPLHSHFDVRIGAQDVDALTIEILGWIETCRRDSYRPGETIPVAYASLGTNTVATECLESDTPRAVILEQRGWTPTDHHAVRYRRSLAAHIDVPVPDGYRARHVTEADIEARAELHRLAWNVWGPSQFSANRLRRLRATPEYREDLDVVIESSDGTLVSYCIAWADHATGIATFEPVGTREDHTGGGLGRATVMEGLRRLRETGMRTALIGTSSVNRRALRLFPACGFEFVERNVSWVKTVI